MFQDVTSNDIVKRYIDGKNKEFYFVKIRAKKFNIWMVGDFDASGDRVCIEISLTPEWIFNVAGLYVIINWTRVCKKFKRFSPLVTCSK